MSTVEQANQVKLEAGRVSDFIDGFARFQTLSELAADMTTGQALREVCGEKAALIGERLITFLDDSAVRQWADGVVALDQSQGTDRVEVEAALWFKEHFLPPETIEDVEQPLHELPIEKESPPVDPAESLVSISGEAPTQKVEPEIPHKPINSVTSKVIDLPPPPKPIQEEAEKPKVAGKARQGRPRPALPKRRPEERRSTINTAPSGLIDEFARLHKAGSTLDRKALSARFEVNESTIIKYHTLARLAGLPVPPRPGKGGKPKGLRTVRSLENDRKILEEIARQLAEPATDGFFNFQEAARRTGICRSYIAKRAVALGLDPSKVRHAGTKPKNIVSAT